MRIRIINFLKMHPFLVNFCYSLLRLFLNICGIFLPMNEKTILFASFGGRKFDDSPKALYDEICKRKEFDDWNLIWAFVEPDDFVLERGEKIKIDTPTFFKALLTSHVWISNSNMDRGINLDRKETVKIETWHGTPLKKICGEENQNSIGGGKSYVRKHVDTKTIRCAQSEYDQEIFSRIFHASKESILLSDLPRNDVLTKYSRQQCESIKEKLHIDNKKVILYLPTYREYLVDEHNNTYMAPPIHLKKWEEMLGDQYVLLIRAHYAVTKAMNIQENEFVKDVSNYPVLSELYAASDILISDYSSSFIDYSILDRPMFCFAYDLEEYEEKRGLYLNLAQTLPCNIYKDEDTLLNDILSFDEKVSIASVKKFHQQFAPHAGKASKIIVDELLKKLI